MIGRVFCISALCLYIILLILLSIRFDFYCIVLYCINLFVVWSLNSFGLKIGWEILITYMYVLS